MSNYPHLRRQIRFPRKTGDLNSRSYVSVGKKDDTVYFEICWLFEKVRGIAVPINKDQKPMVEFLVKYEPLSEDGWYYYEADYEEYRQLH